MMGVKTFWQWLLKLRRIESHRGQDDIQKKIEFEVIRHGILPLLFPKNDEPANNDSSQGRRIQPDYAQKAISFGGGNQYSVNMTFNGQPMNKMQQQQMMQKDPPA